MDLFKEDLVKINDFFLDLMTHLGPNHPLVL